MPEKDLDDKLCIEEGPLQKKKSTRKHMPVNMCCSRTECTNVDDCKSPTFKRCAKCKVIYCSRECQRLDWPEHKEICNVRTLVPEETDVSRKILWRLVNTNRLCLEFQILAILKHGLHLLNDEELRRHYFKPIGIDVTVQYEPTHVKNFFRLFDISALGDDTPMSAIPQIVDVRVTNDDLFYKKATYIKILKSTENPRLLEETEGGLPIFIVLTCEQATSSRVPVKLQSGLFAVPNPPSCIVCFALVKSALEEARHIIDGSILSVPIKIRGPPTVKEMFLNMENLIEYMNARIREDATGKNEMYLRARSLSDSDKELISTVSAQPPMINPLDKEKIKYAEFLHKKIAREYIYHRAAEEYGFDKSILPTPTFQGHYDDRPPAVKFVDRLKEMLKSRGFE